MELYIIICVALVMVDLPLLLDYWSSSSVYVVPCKASHATLAPIPLLSLISVL